MSRNIKKIVWFFRGLGYNRDDIIMIIEVDNVKKFIICLLGVFCCMQTVAFASLHTTKVANVESIRSVYGHKDPQEVEKYNQEKLNQEQNKNKDENKVLEEPKVLFGVFLSKDRFFDNEEIKEKIQLAVMSHNTDKNYVFDDDYPPYLILIDKNKQKERLDLSEVKYDNVYWISFKLNKTEIEKILQAEKIEIVIPETKESLYYIDKDKEKIMKKEYKNSMATIEQSYEIPAKTLKEWHEVLTKQ